MDAREYDRRESLPGRRGENARIIPSPSASTCRSRPPDPTPAPHRRRGAKFPVPPRRPARSASISASALVRMNVSPPKKPSTFFKPPPVPRISGSIE